MKIYNSELSVSPTDLSSFLSCRQKNALELSVANGARKRPVWHDPLVETLAELGREHENAYVLSLKATGKSVEDLSGIMNRELALERTDRAMDKGIDIIVQAALAHGKWFGWPDVLLKATNFCSKFGDWSYEPADAKLARETRGGTILQLGVYCELLNQVQERPPEWFYVVASGHGDSERIVRPYRFREYAAYFRLMRARFEQALTEDFTELESRHEAEPVEHCQVCSWSQHCREWWKNVDHLSLVAGLSRIQRRELTACGVSTVLELSEIGSPLPFQPHRGSIASYERVRDQARVQVSSRDENRLLYEFIPVPADSSDTQDPVGLARLPQPCPGDVFFDLEGDRLAGENVREYLFGLVTVETDGKEKYHSWWACNRHQERQAFEAVMDLIIERLEAFPGMHIYHYAP